ncbi:MAG: hypothetical protein ABSF62_09640 [Bryobacteraceae bacterium]
MSIHVLRGIGGGPGFPFSVFVLEFRKFLLHEPSLQPFRSRNAAAFDDRPHGSERKNASAVMGNNHLFARQRMPPFLVAPGSAGPQKAVMAKNSDHLV